MEAKTKLRLVWLAAPAAAAFAAGALAASGGGEAPQYAPVVAPPSAIIDSPRPQVVEDTLPGAPRRRAAPRLQRGKPLPDPFEEGRF